MANGIMQRLKGKIAVAIAYFQVGKSGLSFQPSGHIGVNTTAVNSANTNTTQTLMSFTLPANALDLPGRGIYVEAFGTMAANAAPRTLILTMGGAVLNCGAATQNGVSWSLNGEYIKTSANQQIAKFEGAIGATNVNRSVIADTAVDTAAITISVQAVDASAASNNVVCSGLIIQHFQ